MNKYFLVFTAFLLIVCHSSAKAPAPVLKDENNGHNVEPTTETQEENASNNDGLDTDNYGTYDQEYDEGVDDEEVERITEEKLREAASNFNKEINWKEDTMNYHQISKLSNDYNEKMKYSPEEENKQLQQCKHLNPVPITNDNYEKLAKKWIIAKVVKIKEKDINSDLMSTNNYCHPMAHVDGCEATTMQFNKREDKLYEVRIESYNSKYDTVVSYRSTALKIDEESFIFENQSDYDYHVTSDGTVSIDEINIDILVVTHHKRRYTVHHVSENADWILFTTCDLKLTWLGFSEEVIKNNKQQTFETEINSFIAEHQIPTMVDINLVMKFIATEVAKAKMEKAKKELYEAMEKLRIENQSKNKPNEELAQETQQ